jgi:hypothetical protein
MISLCLNQAIHFRLALLPRFCNASVKLFEAFLLVLGCRRTASISSTEKPLLIILYFSHANLSDYPVEGRHHPILRS